EQFPAVIPAQAPSLAALLAQARANDADLVILDTAPHADGIASEAASHADAIMIPCRPSALDLDAIGASIRLARAVNKPAYVVINAAPVQGVETAETRTALAGAGVELAPMVLHQRKAYAARMHEGRTAQEIEPNGERERERRTGTANGNGKAAGEIRELMLWLCDKVGLLPKEQATKTAKQP